MWPGPYTRSDGPAPKPEHRSVVLAVTPRRCDPDSMVRSEPVEHDGPLDLLDGLGDLDAAGAGLGAVERGPAPEHAALLGQDGEPLLPGLIAGVEDEPVGVHDGRRADVPLVAPVDRARGGAGGAQDALGRVVVPGPLGR